MPRLGRSKDNFLTFYRVWNYVYNNPDKIPEVKTRPWARSLSARSIRENAHEYLCFNDGGTAEQIKNVIENMNIVSGRGIHKATRSGYLNPHTFIIMPFSGQWGAGVVFAEPYKNSCVRVTFYTVYTRPEVITWQEVNKK